MKTKTGKSTASKAWGTKLATPVDYNWSANTYATPEELVAANDQMSLKEQMVARNADAVNKARAAAREAKFLEMGLVKPTAENTPAIAFRDMVKTILTAKLPDGSRKFTQEQAEEQAALLLGYTPDDDSDDDAE